MSRKLEELYYELTAHSEGLKKDLDDAQRHLTRFSKFVQEHPIVVAAAFGAALLELGAKAVEAAAESDTAFRRIAASLPTGTAGIKELEHSLDALALKTGIAGDELEAAAVQAAKLGAGSAEDVRKLVTAAADLSDATGTALPDAIALLTQLRREFHLTDDQAAETAANLASAALHGHVAVDELFGAFQGASPTFQRFNIDAETGTRAIIALVQAGLGVRQVRGEIAKLDGEGIRQLAERATVATDSMKEMEDRAETVRGATDRLAGRIKNELNDNLKELGELILPSVNKGLQLLGDNLEGLKKRGGLAQNFRQGFQDVINVLGNPTIAFFSKTRLQDVLDKIVPPPPPALPEGFQSAIPDSAFTPSPGRTTLPLGTDEKKKIADILASARKALEEFEATAAKALDGGTENAVASALEQLAAFRAKFLAATADIQEKIAALPAGAPASARAALEASARELAGLYAKSAQAQLDALDRLAKNEADSLKTTIGQSLGELTGTLAEHGAAAIEQQNAKLREQILLADGLTVAEKERLLNDVKLLGILEQQKNVAADATKAVDQIIQAAASASPEAAIAAINTKSIELKQTLDGMVRDGGEQAKQGEGYKQMVEQLLRLDKERAEILKKLLGIQQDTTKDADKRTQELQAQARVIQQAVDGAVQLAQAFGLVNQQTATILRSVGQIAAGIGPLIDQIHRLGNGTGSIGAVIGAALPIAGGVASLIQAVTAKSPEEIERQKVLLDNTAAIRDLTKHVGLLGSSQLAGTTAGAAAALIQNIFAGKAGKIGIDVSGAQVIQGLSGDQLDTINAAAKALGLTFDGTVKSLLQVEQALNVGIPILGKFGDSVADMLGEIDAEAKILGKNSPLDNLSGILGKLGDKSKGIASIFEGIDTSKPLSADDIAKIRERVQELFKTMETTGLTLDQLGDLNGDQFLQILEQVITDLDAMGGAAQSASEKIQQGLNDIGQNAAVLGETPDQVFIDKAKFYGDQFGEPFKKLFEGVDLTTKEGVDTVNERIKAFWKGVEDGSIVLDTSVYSLDDFKNGIIDIAGAATSAANAFETAAQTIADAENQIAVADDILGTSAQGTIGELSQLYGIDLSQFDLTSQQGTNDAIAFLQSLFKALDPNDPNYKEKAREIQVLVDKLRGLGFAGAAAGAAAAGIGAGATTATGSAIEGITHQDSNRLADLWTTALGIDRQQLAVQQQILAALTGQIITGPILPPILPAGFGGLTPATRTGSAGAAASRAIGGDTYNFYASVHFDGGTFFFDKRTGELLGRDIAAKLANELADQVIALRKLQGDTTLQ